MPLQFRKGKESDRSLITPASGEPLWTTDTHALYVGDGVTPGGIAISNTATGAASTSSLVNGSAIVHLNSDGTMDFPNDTIVTQAGTTSLTVASSGTEITINQDGVIITPDATDATHSSVLINQSGTSTYQPPHQGGYALWAINKPGASARIVTDQYGNNSNVWTARRARGTADAPTAAQSGDLLLRIAGTGYGTTEFENTSSSYIDFNATENMTDGAHGTSITLNTTNSGTNTVNASLKVRSDGTIITAPQASATESVLTINKSGLTSYPAPVNVDGYDIWAIRDQETARGVVETYGTGVYPAWQGRRARGTAASPSAVQEDDVFLSIRGSGFGATQYAQTSTGYINFSAIENFTDTARGTRILFATTPAGSVNPNTVATMRSDGVFVYSTATTGNGMLTVQGSYPNLTFELSPPGTNIQAINTPGTPGRVAVDTYADDLTNNIDKSYYIGRRARGTASAPSAVLANDGILRIAAYPYGTTGFLSTGTAGINFVALENITDSAGGGKITFDVMPIGAVSTSSQTVAMTLTAADGATVDQLNVNNLTINNAGEILSTTASDIDLYTNNGTGNFSEVWLKHNDGVYILADGASTNQWSFDKSGQLTFPDSTIQTTAWTGSVSTSSVTGLATVAWTGKYSDLTGEPNQALDTTSAVTFAGVTSTGNITANAHLSATGFTTLDGGARISAATVTNALSVGTNLTAGATTLQSLSVTTGSVFTKTVSLGGAPLNASGTSSFTFANGASPIAVVSNYVAGVNPAVYFRGYGGNNPTVGQANPRIIFDSARGTVASPTTTQSGDNLMTFNAYGYDGANWGSDTNTGGYNVINFSASENMTSTGTTTLQAGSTFNLFAQPQWTRPGTAGNSRHRIMLASWTTASGGPSAMTLNFGDNVTATITMVDGTTYIGPGRINMNAINMLPSFYGVPTQDTAPDNATLTGTNFMNLVASRRNSASGRRNQIQSNDTIYTINFRGQNSNNATSTGVTGASIGTTALETYAAGAYGTSLSINTVNSGTTTMASRAFFSDAAGLFRSDRFAFQDKSGTFNALSFNTNSNAVFGSGVTVGGTGVTYPGDGQIQNLAWQPAYVSAYDTTLSQTTGTTTGLNTVVIGSVSTASGVTLVSNGARVTNAGVYNIQQSIQFVNSGAGAEDVVVWLRQNSTDLTNTAGVISVPGQHGGADGKAIASWNYVINAAANDTFYLMWQPQATSVSIATTTVGTGTPQAPGVILTVVRER